MEQYFQNWWDHFSSKKITLDALKGPLSFTPEIKKSSLESQVVILCYVYSLLKTIFPQDKMCAGLMVVTGLKKDFLQSFLSDLEKNNLILNEIRSLEEFTADNYKIYNFSKTFSNRYLYGEKALVDISNDVQIVIHPADQSGLDNLKSLPLFETLIKGFHEIYDDKVVKMDNLGKYIHVTPKQYPDLYFLLKETCEVLGLKKEPDLYLGPGYINAFTSSITDPCIILSSGVLQTCNRDEIMFIIGHEIGHIMCKHLLYTQMSNLLPKILASAGRLTMGATNLIGLGVELRFRQWSRSAEFTADRFGLMACQNVGSSITTLLKLSGAPPNMINQIDLNEYLKQYDEYSAFVDAGLNKAANFMAKIDDTHPYSILRVKELINYANKMKAGLDKVA